LAINATTRAVAGRHAGAGTVDWHVDDRRLQWAIEPVETTPAGRRDAIYRRSLAVADLVALALTALLVFGAGSLRPGALILAVLAIVAAKTMGLYDRDQVVIAKRTLDEAPGLFQLSTLLILLFALGRPVFTDGSAGTHHALIGWAVLLVALLTARAVARHVARGIAPVERCLVVAEAADHRRIDDKLADERYKARVVAHLPLLERRASSSEPPHQSLERCVDSLGIHRVLVAPDGVDAGVVLDVVSRAKELGVNVSVLPRVCEVVGSSVQFDDLGGMTLLGVRSFRLSRSTQVIKRSVDLVGTAIALVLGAPLMAIIAVAIKLDSRGPVFFCQTRVGQDGRHFCMIKFRSMFVGAHARRDELDARSLGGGLFKVPDDPRVTRVGRLLRRTSLDELPQLINVLRGDMSLVGPRPLILEEDALVLGRHRRRLHLKPGLTGPWQVLGSPEVRVGMEDMATIDYLYTVNWSLWADIKVILRTAVYILGGRGV
jgi:exopolysaccharide biosynthesis polyprenyl glycosylphosphotransferase